MATGYYDANGIWRYGESDNIAPFSETLNKLANSSSDAFTSDRARLATLEAGSLAGTIPVKPSSIVVASGSGSVGTLGVVTFTGATAITLNNIFTTAYANYRVLLSFSSSASMNINGRFTVGGAQQTVGYYAGLARAAGNVFDNYSATNTSFFTIGQNASAAARSFNASIDVFSPQVNGWTGHNNIAMGFDGTYGVTMMGGGHQQSGIQADGIYIYPTAGNISGTIQVFGYND